MNLWPDDLGWPMDIGALALLDGTRLLDAEGRFRLEVVREAISRHLPRTPRLRQVLHVPGPGLGGPVWVDAAAFDLAEHVQVLRGRHRVGAAQLLVAASGWSATAGPRPAAVADVVAARPAAATGGPVHEAASHHRRRGRRGGRRSARCWISSRRYRPGRSRRLDAGTRPERGELLQDNLRCRRGPQGLARALSSLAHPAGALRRRATWPAWREFFAEQRAPRTSLNRPIGVASQACPDRQPPGPGQADRPRPRRQGQRRGAGRRRGRPAGSCSAAGGAGRPAGAASHGPRLAASGAPRQRAGQPGRVDGRAAADRRARPRAGCS